MLSSMSTILHFNCKCPENFVSPPADKGGAKAPPLTDIASEDGCLVEEATSLRILLLHLTTANLLENDGGQRQKKRKMETIKQASQQPSRLVHGTAEICAWTGTSPPPDSVCPCLRLENCQRIVTSSKSHHPLHVHPFSIAGSTEIVLNHSQRQQYPVEQAVSSFKK